MKVFRGFLRWLAALAFSLSAGLLVIIFLADQSQISNLLLRLIMLAAVGFISGFFIRLFFRRWIAVIALLISWLDSLASILLIDRFYTNQYALLFINDAFQFQLPTIEEGAQIALLLLASMPPLLLFRRKKVKSVPAPAAARPSRKQLGTRVKEGFQETTDRINPKNWSISLPKFQLPDVSAKKPPRTSTRVKPTSKTKADVHIQAKKSSVSSVKKASAAKKVRLPKSSFHGKQAENDVKLVGEEEHICPYCLEHVEKNDPNGVAICKECGTWHHQDCWDITGACGVAHRNNI